MSDAPAAGPVGVEVVYALRGRAWRLALVLPAGTTVAGVLAALRRFAPAWPEAAFQPAATAVFGREVEADHVLRDGERLELLRELPTDPKRARRARAETAKPR